MLPLTFNPGLMLTGFETTRPWNQFIPNIFPSVRKGMPPPLLFGFLFHVMLSGEYGQMSFHLAH